MYRTKTHQKHSLTTMQQGCVGEHPDAARDDMYVDASPYVSLRGIGLGQDEYQKYAKGMRNPRTPTKLDYDAIARTRGSARSVAINKASGEGNGAVAVRRKRR